MPVSEITEIGYYRIEAGSARYADFSSHSQPHKLVMENILHYIIFQHFYQYATIRQTE